jgi:EAL domain-containing protein (putative c-di-GMP-specific phosphodiesterase class I)
MLFSVENALDLKRHAFSMDSILTQLAQTVQEYFSVPCEFFQPKESELIVLLSWVEDMPSQLTQLFRQVSTANWLHEQGVSIDLSSSYFASDELTGASDYLYETLREATVLIRSQEDFVAITEQYITAKKRQLTIKSDVAKALAGNQFSLVYQPKVTLANGLVENAEVLLRWQHAELGWISPVEIIEIAEADGQIIDIGEWVLKNGIAQLSRLLRVSHEVKRLSINVSVNQLTNLNIVNSIKRYLQEYSVEPEHLVIEITETGLIKNLKTISKTLHAIKQLGVSIAIDDFGVGYSSFAYLSKLPIDILKIDRALIDDIEYNQDTQVLMKNLVQTCHNLNIDVVAEGVETLASLQKINLTECDYVQGYYYSAPVKAQEIEHIFVAQPFRTQTLALTH